MYHGISRPEGSTPDRRSIPGHEQWKSDRWTGSLTLQLTTPPGQFVSPGTGRLVLTEKDGASIVAQEVARSGGTPVIPGSGIKGAVRTVYELLSCSCNPFQSECSPENACEACSLFGLSGWSGRVTFTDARPIGDVELSVEKVPVPWEPKAELTPGDFRVYDLGPTLMRDPDRPGKKPAPEVVAREVLRGAFATRLLFWNVSEEELGRLLLALGVAPDFEPRFLLRLGGVKYHGRGGVAVRPIALILVKPKAEQLAEIAGAERCRQLLEVASCGTWARKFWGTLRELAQLLNGATSGARP